MAKTRTRRSKKKSKSSSGTSQPSPEDISLDWTGSVSPERTTQVEAGPSSPPASTEATTDTKPEEKTGSTTQAFAASEDFIAFEDDPVEEDEPRERDWSRDKRKDWDGPGRGTYRGRDDRNRDDRNGGRRTHEARRGDQDWDRKGKGKAIPWAKYVDWDSCRNVAELFHEEVKGFLHYITPTRDEHEVRSMIVQLIARGIKSSYPDAEVLPFGSFGTKLYLPDGDIDLVVMSQSLAYSDKRAALRSLANIVKNTGVTDKVTVISGAKVPIVKFTTLHGHFAVDISMNQANGVATCHMINAYLEKYPALRAIILIIKAFLKQRSLNEVYSGGLGSYSIVCLAVSFLQLHPKIQSMEIEASDNLGVLVVEFFELYGKHFNYSEAGISLVFAGSYFNKDKRGWKDYNKPHLLTIEDPGDTSNDISRGSFGIRAVKQTFAGAYEILSSALYERARRLSARRDRSRRVDLHRHSDVKDLFDPDDPDAMSVLNSIVSVSQATINHRRLVHNVYMDGHLARMLGLDPPNSASRSTVNVQNHERKRSKDDRKRKADSVAEAWGEADMVLSSDDDRPTKRRHVHDDSGSESRYQVSRREHRRDEGDVHHVSPHKRRRTSSKQMFQQVSTAQFVSSDEDGEDDSEEEDGEVVEKPVPRRKSLAERMHLNLVVDNGLEEIEEAYEKRSRTCEGNRNHTASDIRFGDGRRDRSYREGQETTRKSDERRAFWASKGVAQSESDSG